MQKKLYALTLALLIVPAYIAAQRYSASNARELLPKIKQQFVQLRNEVAQAESEAPQAKEEALQRINAAQKNLVSLTNDIAKAKVAIARESVTYKSTKKGAEPENTQQTEQELKDITQQLIRFNRELTKAKHNIVRLNAKYLPRNKEDIGAKVAEHPRSRPSRYSQQ